MQRADTGEVLKSEKMNLTRLSTTKEGYVAEITASHKGVSKDYRVDTYANTYTLGLISVGVKFSQDDDYVEYRVAGQATEFDQLSAHIPVDVLNYATARMAEKHLRKIY